LRYLDGDLFDSLAEAKAALVEAVDADIEAQHAALGANTKLNI